MAKSHVMRLTSLILIIFPSLLSAQNDDFADAIDLSERSLPFSLYSGDLGTDEPFEPPHAGSSAANSVWYKLTSSEDSIYSISEFVQASTIRVAVYHGSNLQNLTLVAEKTLANGNDRLFFQTQENKTVYIAVDSPSTDILGFRSYPLGGADEAADAPLITDSLPFLVNGNNVFATAAPDDDPLGSAFPATSSVWWSWTAPADAAIRVDIRGSEDAPSVKAYQVEPDGSRTHISSGLTATCFSAVAGTTYLFCFDETNSGPGHIQFYVHSFPNTPPPNDDLANARDLGSDPLICDGEWIYFASSEPGVPNEVIPIWATDEFPHDGTLWWTWTCPQTSFYEIASYGSDWYPRLSKQIVVYTGPETSLTPHYYSNSQWSLRGEFIAGTKYWIQFNAGQYRPHGRVELTIHPSNTPTPYFETLNEESLRLLGSDRHPYADPDLDGVCNGAELACRTNPEKGSHKEEYFPRVEIIANIPRLIWGKRTDYTQNAAGLPIQLIPETSTNFLNWQTAPVISQSTDENASFLPASPTNSFIRLRLSDPNLLLP